ncbi:hypothetical protein D584_00235 [Brucella intermedia M86]|uniref:Uncharacterized protein n=1 Tax=Brucella intermedia M86 TaxID=1234597 RepID=M5JSQ9_9HYPH|nr:hypothetical protein D584_00235 [Brucella intermedia M86]
MSHALSQTNTTFLAALSAARTSRKLIREIDVFLNGLTPAETASTGDRQLAMNPALILLAVAAAIIVAVSER